MKSLIVVLVLMLGVTAFAANSNVQIRDWSSDHYIKTSVDVPAATVTTIDVQQTYTTPNYTNKIGFEWRVFNQTTSTSYLAFVNTTNSQVSPNYGIPIYTLGDFGGQGNPRLYIYNLVTGNVTVYRRVTEY